MRREDTYKSQVYYFLNNKLFMAYLIILAIMAYGYFVFHYSPNPEEMLTELYYAPTNAIISQGRFGTPLLHYIFNIFQELPLVMPFLGVIFLIMNAILFSAFVKFMTLKEYPLYVYMIFAGMLIVMPFIQEIIYYPNQAMSIPLCYMLTTISIVCISRIKFDRYAMFIAILSFMLAMSIYESFLMVFALQFIFFMMLLINQRVMRFRDVSYFVYAFAIIVGMALIYKFFISDIMKLIFNSKLPSYSQYVDNYIQYDRKTLGDIIISIWKYFVYYFYVNAFFNYSVWLLDFSLILSLIFMLFFGLRRSKWNFLFIPAMIGFVFFLPIYTGKEVQYRTYQVASLFVPIVFLWIAQFLSQNNRLAYFLIAFLFVLVIRQAIDVSKWLFLNHQIYKETAQIAQKVANDIYDISGTEKPIAMFGRPRYSKQLYERTYLTEKNKLALNFVQKGLAPREKNPPYDGLLFMKNRFLECSFWYWGLDVGTNDVSYYYSKNGLFLKFMAREGYEFENYDGDFTAFDKIRKNMPQYPDPGYIKETDDCIVVNF